MLNATLTGSRCCGLGSRRQTLTNIRRSLTCDPINLLLKPRDASAATASASVSVAPPDQRSFLNRVCEQHMARRVQTGRINLGFHRPEGAAAAMRAPPLLMVPACVPQTDSRRSHMASGSKDETLEEEEIKESHMCVCFSSLANRRTVAAARR